MIRCKECRHWERREGEPGPVFYWGYCTKWSVAPYGAVASISSSDPSDGEALRPETPKEFGCIHGEKANPRCPTCGKEGSDATGLYRHDDIWRCFNKECRTVTFMREETS